jgi:hypothetical protein
MGLLQEQTGSPAKALDYYRRAFKFAPELADPEINPELLYSKLDLGAMLRHNERDRFSRHMPMPYMQPDAVSSVRAKFEPEPELKFVEPGAPPPPPPPASTADKPPAGKSTGKVEVFHVGGGDAGKASDDEEKAPSSGRITPAGRLSPRPEGSSRPAPRPEPSPGAMPGVGSVSPEASLLPWWPSLLEQT